MALQNEPQVLHDGSDVGAVVLCGGLSRRLGCPKESLRFGGITLLERTVLRVGEVADAVVVAGRADQRLPNVPPNATAVFDAPGHAGPLAGIAAGLEALLPHRRAAIVVACDYPFLRVELLRLLISRLVEGVNACVPSVGGRLEPLLAIYRTGTCGLCRELLNAGERRAHVFAERCRPVLLEERDVRSVDPDLISFRDVDDPESLRWAEAQFREEK